MKDLEKIVQELEEKISTSLREGETEQDIEKVRINYFNAARSSCTTDVIV